MEKKIIKENAAWEPSLSSREVGGTLGSVRADFTKPAEPQDLSSLVLATLVSRKSSSEKICQSGCLGLQYKTKTMYSIPNLFKPVEEVF